MIQEKYIVTSKTARYFTLGELTEKTKTVWIVFHGYGQLAKDFLNKFTILENDSTLVIAPEALNKFYLRGFTGKIGATWMTKEDRENEIIDYVKMINEIYKSIKQDFNLKDIKITVLGFSQGTQTAVRWLDKYRHKVNNLFLWGGSFPHDCNYDNDYWSNIKSHIVIGNKDKFISKEMLKKEIMYFKSQNISCEIFNFDGGHELDSKILIMLSSR
ncbi:MAG: phospholipase [Ignavibacteriae bacterium]|nr:phospholipase [Ignavibacteriota bacterium]